MRSFEYDLLVIGGGPGGSTAAAFARQQGLRTLVVEKTQFPRFHIGESLLPAGNQVLRESGAWPKVVAAGFMPKYGAEFHLGDGTLSKKITFGAGIEPELKSTFQVERSRFDDLLLAHAASLGAEVRQHTIARKIIPLDDGTGRRVTLESAQGEQVIEVPWIIDTTGQDQTLRTDLKQAIEPPRFPKRIAIYNHFQGVVRSPGKDAGNIVVVRLEHGWFWLIPLDDTRTSVGLVTTIEHFQAANQSTEAFWDANIQQSVKLRELMTRAIPLLPIKVTRDYSYFRRNLADDRVVLAGDAAGFLDPVFSSGVMIATTTGKAAALLIAKAHATRRALRPRDAKRYTRAVKRRAEVFHRLIDAFYDADGFEVFMCQDVPWDIDRGITSIVAGQSHLSWPLWWRFQVFLLICRIQQKWPLVKRPETGAVDLTGAADSKQILQ